MGGMDDVEKWKFLLSLELKLRPLGRQHPASRYTDCATATRQCKPAKSMERTHWNHAPSLHRFVVCATSNAMEGWLWMKNAQKNMRSEEEVCVVIEF
jgi:hypothetical protein